MRNATKEKIHSSAIKLFTQKSFASTTVQEIADCAEISTGLVYRHYKTKNELFGALVSEATDGLKEVVDILQSDMSPIDLIKKLTQEILDDISKDEEFAQYMALITQAFMMEDFIPQVQTLMEQNQEMIKVTARLIEKGQRLGQFKQGNYLEMSFYFFYYVRSVADSTERQSSV